MLPYWTFYLSKNPENNVSQVPQKRNVSNIDNSKKCFLSTKLA